MKYYQVEATHIRLAAGSIVHLTDAQAAARKRKVKPVEGRSNVFALTDLATFKKGAQFGCEQKAIAGAVESKATASAFDARIRRERSDLAAWKKAELDKRAAATRKREEDQKRRQQELAAARAAKADRSVATDQK